MSRRCCGACGVPGHIRPVCPWKRQITEALGTLKTRLESLPTVPVQEVCEHISEIVRQVDVVEKTLERLVKRAITSKNS